MVVALLLERGQKYSGQNFPRRKYTHEKYVIPLLSDLSEVDMCDLIDSKTAANKILQLLIDNSLSLVSSVPSTQKKGKTSKKISYVKLLNDVKAARFMCNTAFGS